MKRLKLLVLTAPVALALMFSSAAESQTGATAPAGARPAPGAAAGPAAPAAAALPGAAGPTITAAAEEAALLGLIAGLQENKPDYRALAPNVAQALRRRLPTIHRRLAPFGPVEGIDFLGDGRQGLKRFMVRHGAVTSEWALALDRSGRIAGLSIADPAFAVAPPAPPRPARRAR